MPTQSIVLTEHQENIIQTLVDSGRYRNASDILDEGLRLLQQREAEDAAKLEALREAACMGFDDVDRSELRDLDSIEDLRTHLNDVSEKVTAGERE